MQTTKFYVYLHKRKDNGVVFYVGKGTERRLKRTSSRNKAWKEIVNSVGYDIEILHTFDSEVEALAKEHELLNKPKPEWCLVNKRKTNSVLEIDYNEVNEWLEYSPESATGLRWKKAKRSVIPGKDAGSIFRTSSNLYYSTRLNDKLYLNHRLVYVLCHGHIDSSLVVHHKDKNGQNNLIENLELITQAENSRDTIKQHREGNGVTRRVKPSGAVDYVANWMEDGQNHRKCFLVKKIGSEEEARQLALDYRAKKIKELSDKGYGYSNNP